MTKYYVIVQGEPQWIGAEKRPPHRWCIGILDSLEEAEKCKKWFNEKKRKLMENLFGNLTIQIIEGTEVK